MDKRIKGSAAYLDVIAALNIGNRIAEVPVSTRPTTQIVANSSLAAALVADQRVSQQRASSLSARAPCTSH